VRRIVRVEMATGCHALVLDTAECVHVNIVFMCVLESTQVDVYLCPAAQKLHKTNAFSDLGSRDVSDEDDGIPHFQRDRDANIKLSHRCLKILRFQASNGFKFH